MQMDPASRAEVVGGCASLLTRPEFLSLGSEAAFKAAAAKVADRYRAVKYSVDAWTEHPLNPKHFYRPSTVDWIFVCDLLNFSFWQDETETPGRRRFAVEFNGKVYESYWSLPAVLNRSIAEGRAIADPRFYSVMAWEEFEDIFRPSFENCTAIPMARERYELLIQAGRVLCDRYEGSFDNFVSRWHDPQDAWFFIDALLGEFPSFRDTVPFRGRRLLFLKRAQILVADLWAGSKAALFSECIDQLTIFADYRLPQILASLGLIQYGSSLERRLCEKMLLESGCLEELEIRAAAVVAADRLLEAINAEHGLALNATLLDFYLWDLSQELKTASEDAYPFHRVRSIYY